MVRKSISGILQDLLSSIRAAISIATGRLENRITDPSITEQGMHSSEYDISSSESDASSNPSSGDQRNAPMPMSEIEQLVYAIDAGIDSLFKASIFIRSFAPKEKRLRALDAKPFDNRADIIYVKGRYPPIEYKNAALAVRLGEANARRRQYFKYRREHNERLSTTAAMGISQSTLKEQVDLKVPKPRPTKSVLTGESKPSFITETEATTFLADPAAELQLLDIQETTPAISMVSFATSIAESSDDELAFPPIPDEAQKGTPFLCPYCLTVLHFKRQGLEPQWRLVTDTA